jgi:hypothetical protein
MNTDDPMSPLLDRAIACLDQCSTCLELLEAMPSSKATGLERAFFAVSELAQKVALGSRALLEALAAGDRKAAMHFEHMLDEYLGVADTSLADLQALLSGLDTDQLVVKGAFNA